ncbi:PAS/PAC sensor signal transduction histidine kinase [Methanosalsum zhilinae DSM 4017]|uniref:histidine kinase n=1 Tax=Methanosalsum zhilinae (strain DSM 4017 / NBRC 107636 / OCM 62 / WeN5) TaxID=679901 RepID=F7XL97_METZD|nr:PAS domain S-box protein [Methanosalsum zhilinae]AEH60754.1 PAS/PAC sensor signal transduction histidine kinase [Methanosalsum zhilinae DSM 4017]
MNIKIRDFCELLFGDLQNGIWVVDKNGSVVFANSSMKRFLGIEDNNRSMGIFDKYLSQQSLNGVVYYDRLAVKVKTLLQVIPFENMTMETTSGNHLYGSGMLIPYLDENSNYSGFFGVLENIKSCQNEKEFFGSKKSSEKKLQSVYRNSPVVAFLWSAEKDWPVKYVSENISQFGYIAEELMSGNLKYGDLIHPEDIDKVRNEVARYESEGKTFFSQEYRILTKKGKVRWVIERSLIERNEDGIPIHFQGIIIDITERKKAEKALEESEKKFRALFENANDAILLHDLDGNFLEVNKVACSKLGYARDELLKMNIKDFISPECTLTAYEMIKKAKDDKHSVFEVVHVRKDNSTFPAELSTSHFRYHGKSVILSICRDISERKQAEKKLKKYADELERSNELKDLFTDILRHDLLNPAGIIDGFTETVLEMENNETKIEILQKIRNNNKKIIHMIESASEFARLETMDDIEFKKIDICSLIDDVIENFEQDISQKNMDVEFISTQKCYALANEVIEDVFSNLLSNAIKYSPEGSKILIEIADKDDYWKVQVIDEGVGIPDEHKLHIFDRFKRAAKGGVKGTGLGLAIVKRIVELHKGEYGVEDNPKGKGSKFWITLKKYT